MGNVSKLLPAIHPKFKINASANIHSKEFERAAILDENQHSTIRAGKSLAMTAVDIFCQPKLLDEINKEHIS